MCAVSQTDSRAERGTYAPQDLYVQPEKAPASVSAPRPHPCVTHSSATGQHTTHPDQPRPCISSSPGTPSASQTVGRASNGGVLRPPRRARHPVHVTRIWNSYVQPNRQSASSPLTSITSPSPSPTRNHPSPESKNSPGPINSRAATGPSVQLVRWAWACRDAGRAGFVEIDESARLALRTPPAAPHLVKLVTNSCASDESSKLTLRTPRHLRTPDKSPSRLTHRRTASKLNP